MMRVLARLWQWGRPGAVTGRCSPLRDLPAVRRLSNAGPARTRNNGSGTHRSRFKALHRPPFGPSGFCCGGL